MIQLTDKIAITADEHQYIVGKPAERRDKAGNAYTTIVDPSYHITLGNALKSAVHRCMRLGVTDETITTLRGFITEQQRIQDEFAKLLEPFE